jgi:hypothetical protein
MIIEFFGLPGSGKTYCARQLCEREKFKFLAFDADPTISTYSWSRIVFSMPLEVTVLILLMVMSGEIISRRSARSMWLIRRLMTLHLIARELSPRDTDRVIVIDEGIMQFLLGIYCHRITPFVLSIVWHTLLQGRVDRLTLVTTSESVRQHRLISRSRSPRSEYGEQYMVTWTNAMRVNLQTMASYYRTKGMQVTTIDD